MFFEDHWRIGVSSPSARPGLAEDLFFGIGLGVCWW